MTAAADLNTAICAYLGYQHASFPRTDWGAVADAIGTKSAAVIELPMLTLLAELRGMTPDWRTLSLYQGSEWAVRQVRAAHPEIDDPAAKALVWLFSFENR